MFRDFLKKFGWRYVPGVVFLVISTYLSTYSPIFLGNAVDGLYALDRNEVLIQAGMLALTGISVFLTRYIWRYFIIGNARNLEIFIRERLFRKFQNMPSEFFDNAQTGDLMALAINDIGAVRMTAGMVVSTVLTGSTTLLFSLNRMFGSVHPWLAFWSLLPIVFAVITVVKLGGAVRIKFRRVQKMFAKISGTIQENIMGMRVIKAFHQEEPTVAAFEKESYEMRAANIDLAKTSSWLSPLIEIFFGMSYLISILYGSHLVMNGEITLGQLVTFNDYITIIMMPVVSLGRIINNLARGRASWGRLNDVLRKPEVDPKEQAEYDREIHGEICVKNLTYAYQSDGREVLKNVSFTVPKGNVLGIVGETGSGKTTLIDLLLKFRTAPRGTITVDGVDLCDIPARAIRESVGYVPQEEFLFNSTVGENIEFYEPGCTQEKIEQASQESDLSKDLWKLANGYESEVGERGRHLSGGQKKRVVIARALVKDPSILIFDDVLSSVDVNTEKRILENLKKKMAGKTCIIISQRVSALRDADEILYLNDGVVVEKGSHDALMEKNGSYAKMCRQQNRQQEAEQEGAGMDLLGEGGDKA